MRTALLIAFSAALGTASPTMAQASLVNPAVNELCIPFVDSTLTDRWFDASVGLLGLTSAGETNDGIYTTSRFTAGQPDELYKSSLVSGFDKRRCIITAPVGTTVGALETEVRRAVGREWTASSDASGRRWTKTFDDGDLERATIRVQSWGQEASVHVDATLIASW